MVRPCGDVTQYGTDRGNKRDPGRERPVTLFLATAAGNPRHFTVGQAKTRTQ